jgi:hypothetical protein
MLGKQMSFLSKINTKKIIWPHMDIGFCGLATQNTAKFTQGWLKANLKDHWSKEIWPPRSKLTQKRFFGLTRKVDFVAWPPNTAKITHDLLKANQKDHRSKEIWPPSSKDCNPLDYFMWSEVEREVNKQPHNTLASLKAISDVIANLDREGVIHVYKKFRSWIEADMEATRVFIK